MSFAVTPSASMLGISSPQNILKCGGDIFLARGRFSQIWKSSSRFSSVWAKQGNISACEMPAPAVIHCTSPSPNLPAAPKLSAWSMKPRTVTCA